MFRAFTHLSRSWYGETCLAGQKYLDEVMFGMYDEDGGTTGEMSVKWYDLGRKRTPRLECFDDSWEILSGMKDVLDEMAKVDSEDIAPEKFCKILLSCGFKDMTEEKR